MERDRAHDDRYDDRHDDWHLLKRYYQGECTPEELTRVPAILETAVDRRTLEDILSALDPKSDVAPRRDRAAAYARFEERIAALDATRSPRSTHWRIVRPILTAGIAACLVMFGVFFIRSDSSGDRSTQNTYRTPSGETATVRLADGSTMMLAPATTVAVTPHEVTVTGEAYFTVTTHTARPLVVQTSNATVQVLGTRFAVRHYPNEMNSRVVVDAGRVMLRARSGLHERAAPAILSSQTLAFVTDSGVAVTRDISTREYTSWTRGNLIFEGVPLRDVAKELERAYGVQIQITDTALAKRMVRLEVSVKTDPLRQVLETVCSVLDAHYERQSHREQFYILSPGRMATRTSPVAPSRHSIPQPEQQYGR